MSSTPRIILGVSGSIAAYKAPLVVRELQRRRADVHVVMTPAATSFVTPLVLANLSRHPVAVDMFDENVQRGGSWHIELARSADAMVIAPASAKTLASLAHGIADTPLSCVALALTEHVPLFVAPAMDTEMWEHPATKHNISLLHSRGVHIIDPAFGELASGSVGMGRMQEPEYIVRTVMQRLQPNIAREPVPAAIATLPDTAEENTIAEATSAPTVTLQEAIDRDAWSAEMSLHTLKGTVRGSDVATTNALDGKLVLITAGPTRERIDDVRYISNYSSGKMGFALAEAARDAGARVVLVTGPVALNTPEGIERIDVESADEMHDAVMRYADSYDVAILAAAVADFRPSSPVEGKIKKTSDAPVPQMQFTQTRDILAALGSIKRRHQTLVGFALESENALENGRKKLVAKQCDMIVVNSSARTSSAIGADMNSVTLLRRDRSEPLQCPPASKHDCARLIVAALPPFSSR